MPDFYQNGSFTRSVTAREVGLTDACAGHWLDRSSDPGKYGSVVFTCPCDFRVVVSSWRSGKTKKETIKRWEGHVDGWGHDPDVVYDFGTITLISKHIVRRIFVAPLSYRERSTFADTSTHSGWSRPTYGGEMSWAVLSEAPDARQVLDTCRTRDAAFTAALHVLDLAERRGSRVVRQLDAIALPAPETVRTVTAALLGVTDSAAINELGEAIVGLDELLSLMPALAQKRLQLVESRERKLLSPLERL